MSLVPLPRIVRTTSFGLAVLYTLLFAISAVILGTLVYFTVRTSLDRQMATRIDAEVELLRQELRSEGKAALISEVQERANYFHALDYLVVDAHGNRLAGTLPSMPATEGWGNISAQGARVGDPARRFRVRSVI